VRVTLLNDGTFRVAPYRSKGGYEHVFFVGSQLAYVKPHGAYWADTNGDGIAESSGGSSHNYYEIHDISKVSPNAEVKYFPIYLRNAKGAVLSFWTKYWFTEGTNGGFMYLWGSVDGVHWTWDAKHRVYLRPMQPYTGNLLFSAVQDDNKSYGIGLGKITTGKFTGLVDADGHLPYWCFNGRSGGGTFSWEHIQVDLSKYIRNFKEIRIVFVEAQYGGLTDKTGWNPEHGWYIDDVKVKVMGDGVYDNWRLVNLTAAHDKYGAHSGNYAWVYNDTNNGNLPRGIDSSLITKQIDLTSARSANLDFWIRFNLNPAAGLPPATVRVEISDNNGISWQSITYGVRIGWGASGYGGMAGTLDNGGTGYGWVKSTTLERINCDLSGWAGKSILIRFRIVTNATATVTWDPAHPDDPHGVYIDDVFVYGESYAQAIPENYLWTG